MPRIDVTKIFDREGESQMYGELIRRERDRRVLVVSERSGMGKTEFLRKIKLESTRDYAVPVALVSLDDFGNLPDEFKVVDHIHEELKQSGAELSGFARLRQALGMHNALAFATELQAVQGSVDMSGAVIASGAPRIAGVIFEINADTYQPQPWDDDMDAQGKRMCVEAFLADLTRLVCSAPVVLMFDALDKAEEQLLEWIVNQVCRRALQDWQERKLVVVLAGTDVESRVLGRLRTEEQEVVERLPKFADWDIDQLVGFLEANDVSGLSRPDLEILHTLLRSGGQSLMELVVLAESILRRRRGADRSS